jgi:hypothetical protein
MAQNIEKGLKDGDTLRVYVTPIGDAYTDPNHEFEIQLYSKNDEYSLRFMKNETFIVKTLTYQKAKTVINQLEDWRNDRCRGTKCGMSYSEVTLEIGNWKRNYKSSFNYCGDIINNMF